MPKVILLSQNPLPFSKIGSWTTLYKNYLDGEHLIDYVVCLEPEVKWETVNYSFVSNDIQTKIIKKWSKKPYFAYLKALDEIIVPNQKYIIQVVDNFGIIAPLVAFLKKKGVRNNFYIQFFYHGFTPFYGNFESRWFYENIEEMVLLTHDSYKKHLELYAILPTRFSILHNGINTKQFFPLPEEEKLHLKKKLGAENKTVFVWCSQDRPKKGLHLILDVWKRTYATRQDIVLWVIGCEPKTPQDGVVYLGQILNKELATYFQAADAYLFPTLWHEGFGMSLIEALHSGCFCIASALGGVPEVLEYGKYGKLIENPHFIKDWEKAIVDFLEKPLPLNTISPNIYSTECWNQNMNLIIDNAKKSLS